MARELYTPTAEATDCECPIHADGRPPTVPLGVAFADRVSVTPIDAATAEAIYEAHHSYMPSLPSINLCHHGIQFDGQLVGAITYRFPLLHKLKLYTGPGGELHRDDARAIDEFLVSGGDIVEINRICIGVPTRNLASAGLAASQERFVRETAPEHGVEWLMTFIRVDHTGAMLRALLDKGWEMIGLTEAKQAGNRPDKAIREWRKQRWMCRLTDQPLPAETGQTTLDTAVASP